jgi:predicted enzyme related to lactoylglutathione lyase
VAVSTVGAVVYAADLALMQTFYERVVKLPVTEVGEGFVVMGQVILVEMPPEIAASFDVGVPPERRDDTAVRLVFDVPGIAAARVRAAQLGGEVDPADTIWEFGAFRVCDGHDPEGNPVQLRERL